MSWYPTNYTELDLAEMIGEVVRHVKQASAENPAAISGMVETHLVDYASDNDLPAAVLEKMANMINRSKTVHFFNSLPVGDERMNSYPLVDPASVVSKYRETTLKKSAALSGFSDLAIGERASTSEEGEDGEVTVVQSIRSFEIDEDNPDDAIPQADWDALTKLAADGRDVESRLAEAPLPVLEEARFNAALDYDELLQSMLVKVASDDGPCMHKLGVDVLDFFAGDLDVWTAFSKKASHKGVRHTQPKQGIGSNRLLRKNGGITQDFARLAHLKRRVQALDGFINKNAVWNPGSGGGGGGGTGTKEEKKTDFQQKFPHAETDPPEEKDVEAILGMYGFNEEGRESPRPSAPSGGAPAGPSPLMTYLQQALGAAGPEPDPAVAVEKGMGRSETESTMFDLLNDPVLSEYDPHDVADAYNTFLRASPSLARDPMVARVTVRQMMQMEGLDPMSVEQYARAHKSREEMNNPPDRREMPASKPKP